MELSGPVRLPAQVEVMLLPGEQTLWIGRPDPSGVFQASDLFLVPFSIMWAGFVVFWEATVVTQGAPLLFVLWGLPFLAMGAYLLFGRFLVRRAQLRSTTYVLTDRRAFVARPRRVDAESATNGPSNVTLSRDSRSMTVSFGSGSNYGWRMQRSWNFYPGMMQPGGVTFEKVTDVANLSAALRRAATPAT